MFAIIATIPRRGGAPRLFRYMAYQGSDRSSVNRGTESKITKRRTPSAAAADDEPERAGGGGVTVGQHATDRQPVPGMRPNECSAIECGNFDFLSFFLSFFFLSFFPSFGTSSHVLNAVV